MEPLLRRIERKSSTSEFSFFMKLTGKPLKGQQVFAPMAHVRSKACSETKISRDNFSIIGREKDPYLVKLKESIIIATTRPVINNRVVSVPVDLFMP